MRDTLVVFNKMQQKTGKLPLRPSIGIHSDNMVAGSIGNKRCVEFNVGGDAVNMTSRIEGWNKNRARASWSAAKCPEPSAAATPRKAMPKTHVNGISQSIQAYAVK